MAAKSSSNNRELSERMDELLSSIDAMSERMDELTEYMKRIVVAFSDYDIGEDPYE